MKKYFPADFEAKWQKKWEETGLFHALSQSDKPKKYILDMFPYPSGDGLHVGHFKIYNASDILSRYFRFKGFNVLHPMGWDAFGLPAENYAIKTGVHPKITTEKNVSNIKKQMQMVGFSYDWDREINTTDPNYYKWTQWIFLKLFEKGLAYEDEAPINWCPKDKTGLANEEVVDGKCERCGTLVERKVIRQWILKITQYADRLLEDLPSLDWPQFIKEMQVNWIGRKEGINITYQVEDSREEIVCFTTRPDTNFGATFIVIGPEHPLIQKITKEKYLDIVNEYVEKAINRSEEERIAQGKVKTGVFTGSYAINNLNGKKLPIWVSDFVLGSFGTGAVVGVPGHDKRDFEFARQFDLPIIRVVVGQDQDASEIKDISQVQENEGVMINSEFLDGLDIHQATKVIMDHLEERRWGKRVVNYHLRDWIFSRQRYWGEPIPIIHCANCGLVPVPEDQLPVKLPEVENYLPTGTGESPLATISEWVNTTCPKCQGEAKRETNTMPQWAGSCWYYLRFCDSENDQALVGKQAEKYWMPVDWYIGGAEHAVLHLLYARFWHKFLYDLEVVTTKEPFQKLSSVGLVLSYDGQKMSKSKGNVVRPDDIVNEYGADTLRLYEAFMGPFEASIAWEPKSINGSYKFLSRVWELIQKDSIESADLKVEVALNRLVKKVGEDIEAMKFNTAIAAMMGFLNKIDKLSLTLEQKQKFLITLSPFAPHITEELWQEIKQTATEKSEGGVDNSDNPNTNNWSIHQHPWPEIANLPMDEEEVTLAIQIDGKVRDTMMIQKDIESNREAIEKMALERPRVQKFIGDKKIIKTVYVPVKIISFVTEASS